MEALERCNRPIVYREYFHDHAGFFGETAYMAGSMDTNRYLANLKEERSSAALYRVMAEHENNPKIAEVYLKLAETEDAHAESWAKRLQEAGAAVPMYRPSLRTRVLMRLVRHFGVSVIVPTLARIAGTLWGRGHFGDVVSNRS